ncbi:MAG: hydroxymethylbilane synthase [Bacteroidia bacterium]|nr:hydroxymethylbilane synthase [Bacteroidia bacterium]
MNKKIIIGTRGSDLALWQARFAQQLLSSKNITSELKIIVTSGDKNQTWLSNFDKSEGKNFFTKEIEEALLNKEIDLAVHSFKDVESTSLDEIHHPLVIAGLSKRHAANDVLILHRHAVDKTQMFNIQPYAKIGTSSARRYAQLHTFRPDIEILPLRGNVPTRIEKLKQQQYDGIILARAGIERVAIDLKEYFIYPLPLYCFVPAAGQGIIAFQIRREDETLYRVIQSFSDKNSEVCSKIERSIMKEIGGGCSVPVGVLCEKKDNRFRLYLSINEDKHSTSVQNILEHEYPAEIIRKGKESVQKILQFIENPVSKKIFISKHLDETSYLKKLAEKLKWELVAKPLIQTNLLPNISDIPECDWIFFNSKNAVKHFFQLQESTEKIKNKKLAALSDVTAQHIEKYGYSVHFIGTENDVNKTAQEFAKICTSQRVLFPCSIISYQTIENAIKTNCQVIHFPIYQTVEQPVQFTETFDCLIFTSPSNVRSFFHFNTISDSAKIIAMGESSKSEILKYGMEETKITLPFLYNDIGIAAALLNIL